METAYDDAKSGHFSRRPYIDMSSRRSSTHRWRHPASTSSAASSSTRRTSWRRVGSWDDQREAFGDAVVDPIAERAPNIRDIILSATSRRRSTSSGRPGLTEGNIFQGELSLEQLFFNRPAPG